MKNSNSKDAVISKKIKKYATADKSKLRQVNSYNKHILTNMKTGRL